MGVGAHVRLGTSHTEYRAFVSYFVFLFRASALSVIRGKLFCAKCRTSSYDELIFDWVKGSQGFLITYQQHTHESHTFSPPFCMMRLLLDFGSVRVAIVSRP